MSFKRWNVKNADEAAISKLADALGVSSLTARALAARGFADPASARAFLAGSDPIEDPLHIQDIDKAAARINEAIENDERIAVFGDYDVDGITATTVLYTYLQSRGADVVCSLPARESTGYGLSRQAVDNLKKYGVRLIVTVDNGISAFDETAYAAEQGLDIVVCDHHLPGETLPAAVAVVDPLRADDSSSFKPLAGVGVAFKLICAVEGCAPEELFDEYGWLVAIGTIADIMPLAGENRRIVREGLAALTNCDNAGLRALCVEAGADIEALDAQAVAFTVAPRLNAAGRMGNAELALQLLITDDEQEAAELAKQLEALNRDRQQAETEVAEAIAHSIAADPDLLRRPVLIVSGENLHAGVIGIACSRLVESYGKPVILISLEGDNAKGSGRSVKGFSLYEAIRSCADLLQKFGGHELAAGFTLKRADLPRFLARIDEYCRTHTYAMDCPELRVDGCIDLAEVSESAVAELTALAPFGRGNEEPVFALRGATLAAVAPLGDKHVRLTFRAGSRTLTGALFGVTPERFPFKIGAALDAAFCLTIYNSGARSYVSTRFRDVAPAGLDERAFASVSAYRCLCAGRALDASQRELLAPTREEVAVVYRYLRRAPLVRQDYCRLVCALPSLPPGKTSAVLDILTELGLAEPAHTGGEAAVAAAADTAKRELSSSPLYCLLCEGPQ